MKAVVFRGISDIQSDDMPEPKTNEPADAIVWLTANAICGADLHMVRDTMAGIESGATLDYDWVGVAEGIGANVQNINVGDRAVVLSTISCRFSYCRVGNRFLYDTAKPDRSQARVIFLSGLEQTGLFNELKAK